MLLRVLDLETTGTPDEGEDHGICEVGFTDVFWEQEAKFAVVDEEITAFLVNPRRPIPPQASAVHHIVDADVALAVTPSEAVRAIHDGEPAYLVAHNADFEKSFVDGCGRPWLCTYKIALRLWPEIGGHSNSVLRYLLALPCDREKAIPAHRAGPDSYVTAHLLARILEEAAARGISLETMTAWSGFPALHTILNFGKHKGTRWDAAPLDYLDWIINKSELDRDTKANAKYWRRKRTEQSCETAIAAQQ